ncbi:MAG: hypothetical protein KatS3mg022_0284 [Armatimonadota bacterium]|nr:MAG: hypothetical protein KatS3mg022_0284 [Armatimonadota bacterium]
MRKDRTVDNALLAEFGWAIEEAYEALAMSFGNILAGEDATSDEDADE